MSSSLQEASRKTPGWADKPQIWLNQIIRTRKRSKLIAMVCLTFVFACAYIFLAPISKEPESFLIIARRLGISSFNKDSCSKSAAHSFSPILQQPTRIPKASNPPNQTSSPPVSGSTGTTLDNIVFGIGASAETWDQHGQRYTKLWWKPGKMRGYVWLDEPVENWPNFPDSLPPIRISETTSQFNFTNRFGPPSAIRISRIVSETYRLNLPNVHWFVMGDDDTVFFTENLVQVLAKYDHNLFHYIGSNSESHRQTHDFSTDMAFGGAGFAISHVLAKAFERMQDSCLHRYPHLYGSDERVHACISELGVPLTKEPGFHQIDIRGDAFGFLSAHPLTPLLSLHHLSAIDPLFPTMSQDKALLHLLNAAHVDPSGILQQSICYDKKRSWSMSVSWGYAVQVYRGILPSRELQNPMRTFATWKGSPDHIEFNFRTRPLPDDPCLHPIRFYLESVEHGGDHHSTTMYKRAKAMTNNCIWETASPTTLDSILVLKEKASTTWFKVPHRQCCDLTCSNANHLQIHVGSCREGEIIA
ncbi:hypothetical protein O6H91_19G067800 [Diphasiastrum complanatum]|uniref:Uncharacterized protein n=1 Tax=Diphasiastrum complanatum TaxID=34168 RepID=A0ACC2AW67_DIPCM|nr:hypothetical protein O6H91_19G067800 [Diphasiastrum complanatum]